jgi:hypothetical protein
MGGMNDIDIEELAARYTAVFNEPDAEIRDGAVAALWAADARMCTAANEYVGLDAITKRVVVSYEKFIAAQGNVFRLIGRPDAHHDGVRIRWEMVPAAGGAALSAGSQFLLLDADGRVRTDFQFIDF